MNALILLPLVLLGQTPSTAAPSPAPKGLAGTPGGLHGLQPLNQADPKLIAFENAVLEAINAERQKRHNEPVIMDEKLRVFARHHAEAAANGDPQAQHVGDAITAQNLGSIGYRTQYSFGGDANAVLANVLKSDPQASNMFTGDFMRAGIGGFYVPETPPYYQTLVMLVADVDPMAGKPGLNPAQTDPVMLDAQDKLQACYNTALKKNPNLQGDVLLRVVIRDGGAVESVAVPKSLGDIKLDNCLQATVRALQFPAPYKNKPVTLNHPMRFTRPQSDRKLGKLTGPQMQAVFASAAGDFRACFIARQKVNPKLSGTLTLTGVIAGDGIIKSMDVLYDELDDLPLRVCALSRAQKLVFPVPQFGGEVDVTYPLRFGL